MCALSRLLIMILSSISLCEITLAAELPRYSLPVGRKLTYATASESKAIDGSGSGFSTTGSWQITVVRENPDGSRRVILRLANTFSQNLSGETFAQPQRVMLAYSDIFSDGRVLPNKSLAMHIDLSTIMPVLPPDAERLSKGWVTEDKKRMDTISYMKQSSPDGEFTFNSVQDGVMNKVYLMGRKLTYHFDLAKGIISSIDGKQSQDYGFHSRGTLTTKLESDQTLPAEQVAKMATEFDILFAAREQYETKMGSIEDDPANADTLASDAKSTLKKAREQATTDAVKQEFEKNLASHDMYAQYAKAVVGQFKDRLNKPAAEWETTDLDGKPIKMADYRGKVIVMDFWYRGCGPCIYAMPQIRQLAEDFADKPVVVLGMNTDLDEKDARIVVDVMGLKHPNVKAGGIALKYGVEAFPTLIIIDQQGTVRSMHSGYKDTLGENLAKKVRELLENKTAKAAG